MAKYKVGDILVYMYIGGFDSEPVEETMIVDRVEEEGDDIRYYEQNRFVYEEDVVRSEKPKMLIPHLLSIMCRVDNFKDDLTNGRNPQPEELEDIAEELAKVVVKLSKKLYTL